MAAVVTAVVAAVCPALVADGHDGTVGFVRAASVCPRRSGDILPRYGGAVIVISGGGEGARCGDCLAVPCGRDLVFFFESFRPVAHVALLAPVVHVQPLPPNMLAPGAAASAAVWAAVQSASSAKLPPTGHTQPLLSASLQLVWSFSWQRMYR